MIPCSVSILLTLIFSIGGTHKHSRLSLSSPNSALLESCWRYPLSIARRGRFHKPIIWGDLCCIRCDWTWGVYLPCFYSKMAGQLIMHVVLKFVDKIWSSQRKNRNRICIWFIFSCLLFLHSQKSKCICCILSYIKLSCRNIHYSFIVSKTHWNKDIKHLANIHLCGPNGIFKF